MKIFAVALFISLGFASAAAACPSILSYGGDNTGANNNDTAFTSTLAAENSTQKCVYFPAGTYKFAGKAIVSLSGANASVTLEGDGAETSQLVWNYTPAGIEIDETLESQSFHVRDMALLAGFTGSASGLTVTQSGAYASSQPPSDVSNVVFRGADCYGCTDYWANGINVNSVSTINFINDVVYGGPALNGVGVNLVSTAAIQGTVYNFIGCTFNYNNIGINYGAYTEGVTVSNTNFTGGRYGINVPASTPGLDQLTVVASQFNNTVRSIYEGSSVPNTSIQSNLFITSLAANAIAVDLVNTSLVTIVGNSFNGTSLSGTNALAIESSSAGGTVTGNMFSNYPGAAVWLLSGSTGINVQSNQYINNGTKVLNSGTGNTVGGGSQ